MLLVAYACALAHLLVAAGGYCYFLFFSLDRRASVTALDRRASATATATPSVASTAGGSGAASTPPAGITVAGDTSSNIFDVGGGGGGGGGSSSSGESDTESDSGLSECGYDTEMVERADESSEEDEDPFGDGSPDDCDDGADGGDTEFEEWGVDDAGGDEGDHYRGPRAPTRVIDSPPYDLCS